MISFPFRPASVQWEQVPFGEGAPGAIWVWYQPESVPDGIVILVSAEMFHPSLLRQQMTLRALLTAAGMPAELVADWSINGVTYTADEGHNPLLDQPIPDPAVAGESQIVVRASAPAAGTVVGGGELEGVFAAIDQEWNASLNLESQLATRRTQLVDMQNRLNKLNRDLTPEERLHGDRADVTAWQTARRFLRDGMNTISRLVKAHDIGDGSSAGQRKWFEQTYHTYIVTRTPFEGLEQAAREFTAHRKSLQTLLASMGNAHTNAAIDAERRAQALLAKLAAKARARR